MSELNIYQYRVPLHEPLRLKQGLYAEREGLILASADGQYGEVAPFPGLSHENLADCLTALADPDLTPPPALAWGLQMLKHPLTPLPEPVSLPVNALLTGTDTGQLLAQAEALTQEGYQYFKLKVGLGSLEQDLIRVCELLKRGLKLRLDANRSWDLDTARYFIKQLPDEAGTGIDYLEEPLSDPALYSQFRAECPYRLALDETLAQGSDPKLESMADVFVLKPMLLGPERVQELIADAQGRALVFSSVFESGLGLRYLALLSQQTPGAAPAGLDTWRYLAADIWEPAFTIAKGSLNFSDTLFTLPPLLQLKWVRQTA